MKIIPLAILLFLVALPIAAMCETAAGYDFLAWAQASSKECDIAWNKLTEIANGKAEVATSLDLAAKQRQTLLGYDNNSKKAMPDFCSSSGMSHKLVRNQRLLPMSARKRADARRGNFSIDKITEGSLNAPFDRLRPMNSPVQQRNPLRSMGSPTRPKIDRWGRLSRSNQRKSIAHPGSRPDRPRLF